MTTVFSLSERNRPAAASMPARIRSSRAPRPETPRSRSPTSVSSETLSGAEPRVAERLDELREAVAVRGDRDVLDPRRRGRVADDLDHVLAERRLAAGEPDSPHAELREEPEEPRELGAGEEPVGGLLLRGRAVGAAGSCSGR